MSVNIQEGRQSYSLAQNELGGVQSFLHKNEACIIGVVEENFVYSHNGFSEKFYKTRVIVKRLSGRMDFIPIVISETLKRNFLGAEEKGKIVKVTGRFSSKRIIGRDGRKHLHLFLYAYSLHVYESEECIDEETNVIYLKGKICKLSNLRKTLSGKEITELLIVINRNADTIKKDYIPCIAWGGLAKYASQLEVGNVISVRARIQSRLYFKKYSDETEEGEYRIAYEVSIMDIED